MSTEGTGPVEAAGGTRRCRAVSSRTASVRLGSRKPLHAFDVAGQLRLPVTQPVRRLLYPKRRPQKAPDLGSAPAEHGPRQQRPGRRRAGQAEMPMAEGAPEAGPGFHGPEHRQAVRQAGAVAHPMARRRPRFGPAGRLCFRSSSSSAARRGVGGASSPPNSTVPATRSPSSMGKMKALRSAGTTGRCKRDPGIRQHDVVAALGLERYAEAEAAPAAGPTRRRPPAPPGRR